VFLVEFDGQGRVKGKAMLHGIMGPVVKEEPGLLDNLRPWLGW
jgi:hypothetical protein